MSRTLTNKNNRLSKVESTRKTFKIFAVSFHGNNLEKLEEELKRQMEVHSSKKIYTVMVNAADTDTDEDDADQTISEATKQEKQAHQIEEGLRRCKKDFDSAWESLTSTLGEDLRMYWNQDEEDSVKANEGDKSFDIHETKEIFPKKIRKVDLQVLNGELKNRDNAICDYFVLLFGKISSQTVLHLLASSQPLQAIIHFIPCPETDLNANFPKLQKDIDFLRKSPDTKNVGIFIESLNVPSHSSTLFTSSEYPIEVQVEETQKYSQQIYDQFTCYLYDIEMLTQQFIVYQTDFVEINDAELSSHEEQLLWSRFVQMESSIPDADEHDEAAAVGVFLDNLFSTIENPITSAESDSRSSSSDCCLSPFIENNYGKIIVEEGNKLLRSAVLNQLNLTTYWKLVDILMGKRKVFNNDLFELITSQYPVQFYELLSWESFLQRIDACHMDRCYVKIKGDNSICFINSIIRRTKEKYKLPTRLGFRDFAKSIAPDLPNILKNVTEAQNHVKFSGVVIDETLKELTFSEQTFRFVDGSIRFSCENWSNDDQRISVKIQLLGNELHFLRSKSPILRIITQNNLKCFIDPKGEVSIKWPNGCLIRFINKDGLKFIEQSYQNSLELKRFYTSDGLVIRFLKNGKIEVLTPHGYVYMLYVDENSSSEFDFENSSQVNQSEVSTEIYFVRNLEKYGIHCEHFEVTRNNGMKIKVAINGNILEEVANHLVYEWTDYREGKKMLDRDDGVKMIWNNDTLTCYYPGGTIISTTTVEDCIKTNFACETNIMKNIFNNPNPSFVAKGTNHTKRQDSYITYNLNYSMQHKNYATVAVCCKDKMEIHSPDEFKLILEEEDHINNNVVVLIDIGTEISFRIAAGVCTVLSGVSLAEKDKEFKLMLNLISSDLNDLLTFENQNDFLKIDAKGEIIENINNWLFDEFYFFASPNNKIGIKMISEEKYDKFINTWKNTKYLYESSNQTVLLKPILPISELFSMPNSSKMETDLKHFQPAFCHCPPKPAEDGRVFTARVFNRFNKDSQILQDLTDATISNQLDDALKFFFEEKSETNKPKIKKSNRED